MGLIGQKRGDDTYKQTLSNIFPSPALMKWNFKLSFAHKESITWHYLASITQITQNGTLLKSFPWIYSLYSTHYARGRKSALNILQKIFSVYSVNYSDHDINTQSQDGEYWPQDLNKASVSP